MRLTLVQEPRAAAIAIVCDGAGRIRGVIRDSLGLENLFSPGREFAAAVEPQSLSQAHAFIEATRLAEPIEAWELAVNIDGRSSAMCFVGCAVRFNHLVVMGSDSRAGLIRACEELLEHEDGEIPESALRQFLAALRSEQRSRSDHDRETRLYGELESMEKELKTRGAELRRTIEERNHLYDAVAHDLRSPLNAILGYTEILLDEDGDQLRPETRESLEHIQASSGDAVRVIDTLIAQAEADSGRRDLERVPVNIRALHKVAPTTRGGR
jgi:signal transduction histidine kinase